MRARHPKLRILAGVEANIRASGEVDLAEEDLALRDWVVASLHQAQETRPTERVLAAMENPHVDCIGHLTGRRKIGTPRGPATWTSSGCSRRRSRPASSSRSTGSRTGSTSRDVHARAAKRGGRAARRQLRRAPAARARATSSSAVAQARRAWLTKDEVLNTRTWAQVEKLRKRRDRLPRGRLRGGRLGGRGISSASASCPCWRRSSRASSRRSCRWRRRSRASRSRTCSATSTS